MTRRKFTAEEKVAILTKHLLEGQPVSDVCDAQELNPTQFCRWQQKFFENGAAAFMRTNKHIVNTNTGRQAEQQRLYQLRV